MGSTRQSSGSRKSPRRRLDQYFTPESATRALLATHPNISGHILEPCAGPGQMASVLAGVGHTETNDIDPGFGCWYSDDATKPAFWQSVPRPDWVVSNPPFECCVPIIVGALEAARRGVAMLLRLSFLEPCKERADLLSIRPPSLIVLPRISFTGDGKTDNVTCAWMIWDFWAKSTYVKVLSKAQIAELDRPRPYTTIDV
jgi:hypothetical protein